MFDSKSYLSFTLHLSFSPPIYLLARNLLTWLYPYCSINKVLSIEHFSTILRFFESHDVARDFFRSRWASPLCLNLVVYIELSWLHLSSTTSLSHRLWIPINPLCYFPHLPVIWGIYDQAHSYDGYLIGSFFKILQFIPTRLSSDPH